VYVVGGANSAGQAVVAFAEHAARVHMLVRWRGAPGVDVAVPQRPHRHDAERDRARPHEVAAAHGAAQLEGLTLRDARTGATREVAARSLFVFIGAEPRTEWLDGVVARDAAGFVLTGPDLPAGADGRPPGWTDARLPFALETSMPGVFAAGDGAARREPARGVRGGRGRDGRLARPPLPARRRRAPVSRPRGGSRRRSPHGVAASRPLESDRDPRRRVRMPRSRRITAVALLASLIARPTAAQPPQSGGPPATIDSLAVGTSIQRLDGTTFRVDSADALARRLVAAHAITGCRSPSSPARLAWSAAYGTRARRRRGLGAHGPDLPMQRPRRRGPPRSRRRCSPPT
jgi:hypothetical protein